MSDGDDLRAYTVRLELIDRPGELLRALDPIADNGGNLLSIFHERGNLTPRGHIPVEVAFEATPTQFDVIVDALRDAEINVIQAGQEQYGEELMVVLVGELIETDLSTTLSDIQTGSNASVRDFSLAADGDGESSARVRLATESGGVDEVLDVVRDVAADNDLRLLEPLAAGGVA